MSRQYKIKEEEVRRIIQGCTVCINGEPTEEREVAIQRDVPRIPTNRIRGGMCLVISEGIGLKARKILVFAKMLSLDWSWLEGFAIGVMVTLLLMKLVFPKKKKNSKR